ncbi:MAG: signal peptidase I [Bacillus sp. (in: firmicutes)]
MEWLKVIGLGLVLFLFIRTFLFSSYEVDGISMESTLANGDKLVVNRIGYDFGNISRFDIIVFHANNGNDYVKRVIGLPGERLEYKNDQLFIDGQPVDEPFLISKKNVILGQKETGDFTLEEIENNKDGKVPENYLFVMGDNRMNSLDSRHFGFVSIEDVVGKVNIRYWPLDDFYMEL